jgi:glucose/arabinose dehydrogenase/mono/diheme cytochrome c family protein
MSLISILRATAALGMAALASAAEQDLSEQLTRGKALYAAHCLLCHQVTGMGTPGTFPPLAKSDFLIQQRERSIKAVVEGLRGEIRVNGRKYDGAMPPATLQDDEVADVFTFVLNSWGNPGGGVTASEVQKIRIKSAYPTFQDLVKANSYPPLPPAPEGLALREVIRLTEHGVRLTRSPNGGLYLLGPSGNVYKVDPEANSVRQILWGRNYLQRGDTWGFAIDKENRMYITANRRDESGDLVTNRVTIYRTSKIEEGEPSEPQPWFQTAYPWGIGPFNHCVNMTAIGPDGMLYVNSGSRTDGNEPGQDKRYWNGGEHPLTACLWRLDPSKENPELEIYARGLRNAFGFCWNENGEMFATDNGPDAHAPEELNLIQQDRHYGFPFQFSNWTNKPYAYTPDPPAGLKFIYPIENVGPNGTVRGERLFTFDPHSSPAGICQLGSDFPEPYRGAFLVARVGNMVKTPEDVGFDVLLVQLNGKGQTYTAKVTTLLPGLGRPVDVIAPGNGKAYVLEYTRPNNSAGSLGFPGRILELSVKSP